MAKKKAKTKEKNIGAAWHVHHDKLIEHCSNYKGRVNFIKEHKFLFEIKIRLRRFRFVKGKLPRGVCTALKILQRHLWSEYADQEKAQRLLREHKTEIKALHAKECRNCSWNGKTLVFRKRKKKKQG